MRWANVKDGMPPCDGEQVFIGVNTNGYVGAFNQMRPDGMCLYATAEGFAEVMSGLSQWAPFERPQPRVSKQTTESVAK